MYSFLDEVQRILARPITFLLGEYDIFPLADFDPSCPAQEKSAFSMDESTLA
jgi:hypothetical protein